MGGIRIKQQISLQYLRAIAAILVVIYHASATQIAHGMFGVDIFFVISGFIMWATTTATPISPGVFIKRRLIRIVPLYWTLTLLTAFIALSPNISIGFDIDYAWLFHSLFFIASPGSAGVGIMQVFPMLSVGWTLNFEMMFYALFALALFMKPKYRLAIIISVLTMFVVTGALAKNISDPVFAFYTDSISIEFALGAILGHLFMRARDRGKIWNSPYLGAALIVVAFLVYWFDFRILDARGIGAGLPALAVCMGALLMEPALQRYPIRFLKLLGDASYSIYLGHITGLTIGMKVLSVLPHSFPPPIQIFLVAVFAIGFGVVIHMTLEKPMTTRLQSALSTFPPPKHSP